jgi:hypothetical protein
MPIAGFGSEERRDAHVRWAERYAKRKEHAQSDRGRALEFGHPTDYNITIRIHIHRELLDRADGTEFLELIKRGRSPETKDLIDKRTRDLASKHIVAAVTQGNQKGAPNLRVEFYEAGEAGETNVGAHAEISRSDRADAIDPDWDALKSGITEASKAAAGFAPVIEEIKLQPYIIQVQLRWKTQTENAESVIWKHNIGGKIQLALRCILSKKKTPVLRGKIMGALRPVLGKVFHIPDSEFSP